jgi:hypothetical protein
MRLKVDTMGNPQRKPQQLPFLKTLNWTDGLLREIENK